MAISDYDSLLSAVNAMTERSYGSTQLDLFLSLWESTLNRKLGPDYRRETTDTLAIDAAGQATLPTGFLGVRSIVRDVPGSMPLASVSPTSLARINPYGESGEPTHYAISGSTLSVAPIAQDDFTLVYWEKLAPLSSTDTTNWLLTAAPDVYFWGVMAQASAYEGSWDLAAAQEQRALSMLDDLVAQSVVAQFGNVDAMPETVMP